MEGEVQRLLNALADLRSKANVGAVFGEPVESEGRVVIPVAEVVYDFEMGVEEKAADETGGSGGSGGMNVRPLAVVEVTPESTLVKPVIDEQKLALAGALLLGWVVYWLAWTLTRILGNRDTA